MKLIGCSAVVFAGLLTAVPLGAQRSSTQTDEQLIRGLIAAADDGTKPLPTTEDRIVWSAAYKRPVVGSERGEEVAGERQVSNRVPGSERIKTQIRRLEVSGSGDLAYEYSSGQLSFDLKSGQHVSFPNATLRVWKKINGEWRVAAQFSRPLDETPGAPVNTSTAR